MKKKTNNIPKYTNTPIYSYIILLIVFIAIIYLITLRNRVDEFFVNNNNDDIDNLYIKKEINALEVEKIWEGKINSSYLSFWQRKNKKTQDLYSLGQFAIVNKNKLEGLTDEIINNAPILNFLVKGGKFPIAYVKIWSSDMMESNKDIPDFSIWQPVPPDGYVAISDVVVPSLSKPPLYKIVCLPIQKTTKNEQIKHQIFEYNKTNPMSIWNVGNYMAFMASSSKEKPNTRKKDIVDIKEDVLSKHEPDPNEKYKALKVTLKTNK